jgi:AraC family transcriptional regulator, regulatory protein of adaptative response / methylated-DNA-[protein]-cysteine methyltransferase
MNGMTPLAYQTDTARWEAVRTRDQAADGRFFCCVLSTRIYCYPSCAGRPARMENVRFAATREVAIAMGFRACKRCRSDLAPRAEREAGLVARACRAIEAAEEALSLDSLAAEAGFSPFHFHRLFRRVTGVTPKAYAAAHRMARVQEGLRGGASVTEAIYDSGFNSSGRFYEAADGMLGMTPSAFKAGGKGETISWATGESHLGCVLVAGTARGICAILIGDVAHELVVDLQQRFPRATLLPADAEIAAWVEQVIAYVDQPGNGLGLPLDIRGTAFQRQVWEVLQTIPAGETLTYTEVAQRLGRPKAVRAVASACASNRLAVAVPCHRVVASDGGLAGYRWGIARKRALLAREAG